MTDAAVQFVLDTIQQDWVGPEGANSLADVPLERIDRDNSDLLDDTPVHQMGAELEEMNYVGVASASTQDEPLGTTYNLRTTRVVSVRLMGAHVSEYGAIDPQDGSHSYPTRTWDSLKDDLRRTLYVPRKTPSVGQSNAAFKDLFIENQADTSSNYADFYRWDCDIRFEGFETLP